jgi:formyl-CoA transferase
VKDGWIVVAVIGGPMFRRWARLMVREDLLRDPRFQDDLSRGDQYETIAAIMTAWTSVRTSAEAIAALEEARIPSGPAHSLGQTLRDPQVRARELLKYVPYPGAPKEVPLANTPVRLSSTPGGIRHRAPVSGEHTDEVLGQLGFSSEEIAELRAREVV